MTDTFTPGKPQWGNDVVIVVPVDSEGIQHAATIGKVYINGAEVAVEQITVERAHDELCEVRLEIVASNVKIVNEGEMNPERLPAEQRPRKIILRNK